jgi:hypothetical protein
MGQGDVRAGRSKVAVENSITVEFQMKGQPRVSQRLKEGVMYRYEWVNPFPPMFWGLVILDVLAATYIGYLIWKIKRRARSG